MTEITASSPRRARPLSTVLLVVRRELGQYFRTWSGYIFIALLLLVTGLLYNLDAVGSSPRYSADVLAKFFYDTSGVTMFLSLLLSMRVIAEERQTGSYPLIASSPLTDGQIVIAKFISAYLMVVIYLLTTVFMPALVFVNGKVSIGHIVGGYVGLLCIGAAATAIGVWGSALVRSQLFALIYSAIVLGILLILWLAARLLDGPAADLLSHMALHHKHFRPFMDGSVGLSHIIYYLSVTALFLTLARNILEGRRWRS